MATATQPHSIAQFHGLGLLTTVASLPPKYRSRYLSVKTKCETPLDLSVKPLSPTPAAITTITTTTTTSKASPQIANDVPIATTFTEVYTEPETAPTTTTSATTMSVAVPTPDSETAEHEHTAEQMFVEEEVVIMTELQPQKQTLTAQQTDLTAAAVAAAVVTTATPPLSPAGKRKYIELTSAEHEKLPASTTMTKVSYEHPAKMAKTRTNATITRVATPTKPIRGSESATRPGKTATPSAKPTRTKATRKLKFDEETSSPVSGTIIRPLEDITDGTMQYSNGDIDPKYNIVEITEETKAELAAIKNVIGDYVCKLCRIKFDDAFGLARHRCACIVLLEYRCPECGKQFNCPANLASHRRWHKPKKEAATTATVTTVTTTVRKENRNTTNQQQTSQQTLVGKKSKDEFAYACSECGKKFKRQAYLRKHQQTHAKSATSAASGKENIATATTTTTTTATIVATFQTAPYISSASVSSSAASCASTHEDEGVYVERTHGYDYDADSLSDDCSSTSSSAGYGRLQIVENGLTEEESIAAAALTNLRNCASVIQHTTMAH